VRALVLTGPGKAEVQEVEAPVAGPGQVVVDVERAGRRPAGAGPGPKIHVDPRR
jgi:NADPH:quinone reductase-like Zn-dependent oxidoreductase